MQNILHELWYDNICPYADAVKETDEVKDMKEFAAKHYDMLHIGLSDQENEVLEKYVECDTELTGIRESEIFRYAFKLELGAKITFEVMRFEV